MLNSRVAPGRSNMRGIGGSGRLDNHVLCVGRAAQLPQHFSKIVGQPARNHSMERLETWRSFRYFVAEQLVDPGAKQIKRFGRGALLRMSRLDPCPNEHSDTGRSCHRESTPERNADSRLSHRRPTRFRTDRAQYSE